MAQLTEPTARDWVSQVLDDLVELKLELEIEQIQCMIKLKFKSLVKKKAVKKRSFSYLLTRKDGRNSENWNALKYKDLYIAKYLDDNEEEISIQERYWLFNCRVNDIDIKEKHRWKYENTSCSSCHKQCEETQQHLLFCSVLLGINENVTYIPEYSELYLGYLSEQIYVSRLLKENHTKRILDTRNIAEKPM